MNEENRTYIAIDLKSFYASVECTERGLDPLTTNLVVADESRTEKTICLAVSPSLKSYGIPGRARLFEVIQKVKEANRKRAALAPDHQFTGKSADDTELKQHPELAISYLVAPPRMAYYMDYSARIYQIYLKYLAPEDIHIYSIDEVIMDVTSYLSVYGMSAHDLAMTMIRDVLQNTGITATAGIGTNMYLCKIAMDLVAKHVPADENGVRIAELTEQSYREQLWTHRPLTDFWRVGPGYARKLEACGLFTMGDIARCSIGRPEDYYNEELLYRMFGVNAELLIDHAWGWEPCTMEEVKAYRPENNSFCSGQVLSTPYSPKEARIVVQEMTDAMALDLVEKGLATDQLVLTVGYDTENLTDPEKRKHYHGEITTDRYGRKVPKHSHGTKNLGISTSSSKKMTEGILELFDEIVNPALTIRRLSVTTNHVISEAEAKKEEDAPEQLNLFTDYEALEQKKQEEEASLAKERRLQEAMISVKKKYGKNAILKGISLEEGATAKERNGQIGGHRA